MTLLITGICGFVGSQLALHLTQSIPDLTIRGIDNLSRPGSEFNRSVLRRLGIHLTHGDLRLPSDLESLPPCDYVIDAAANPSVLAGIDGKSSPRQLCEHNLAGTLNLLEYCRIHNAGLILLSTSRVYSINALANLPMRIQNAAFQLDTTKLTITGVTAEGLTESFSTQSPISLYGATKLASEIMALEYGATYKLPVWINRCGVLAGPGQFGTAEQGIFSYWLHAHAAKAKLRYIGFEGMGYQVRDALHPQDLAALIQIQLNRTPPPDAIFNLGGGLTNSMSLAQLTDWCDHHFAPHAPTPDPRPRPFDIPWLLMSSARAQAELNWQPTITLPKILDQIAQHVRDNPTWLTQLGIR
jgi:CDP-paratose 2-epimerase